MEFTQLIKERYSVRKFSGEPVSDEAVQAILDAARVAPTAHNNQPQRILVLRSAESMEKLKEATACTFHAPMAMVVCVNRDEAWVRPFDADNSAIVDASIIGTHVMLAVHNLGLGATWVAHFDPVALRRLFNIPLNITPVGIFPIGHLSPEARPARLHEQRRPLEETVLYETF